MMAKAKRERRYYVHLYRAMGAHLWAVTAIYPELGEQRPPLNRNPLHVGRTFPQALKYVRKCIRQDLYRRGKQTSNQA